MNKPAPPTRRRLLQAAVGLPLLPAAGLGAAAPVAPIAPATGASVIPAAAGPAPQDQSPPAPTPPLRPRVRPDDPDWPSEARWHELSNAVGGALMRLEPPFAGCRTAPASEACAALFRSLKNPYALGDDPALTQTLGWVDAWTSMPSVYAVAARNAEDVAAAVDFARRHRLRLVVKGGGHSYQGTSNAADSLLVWTRRMNGAQLHEAFVPAGCEGKAEPVRAVTLGAGAIWAQAYDAVTTRGGGYVQGGGCMTVGVAGLVQSGGYGSFSKAFGSAAGSLLEAELVTADGRLRRVNACTQPELFWGLKGGGGGSLGVLTSLTLRVHPLPEPFGAVNFTVHANSDAAFRRLVGLAIDFCSRALVNPHWGEQIRFVPDNTLRVSMVFQGLDRSQAKAVWQPFLDAVGKAPDDFKLDGSPLMIVTTSARKFWSPTLIKRLFGFIAHDDRPGAPPGNVFWPGDQGQAGQVLHGHQSAWLPAALLADAQRPALADALFAASRHAGVALHLNKGLAGAPEAAIAAARDTATNPAQLDAFALAIGGSEGPPAYPGVAGREPDAAAARRHARAIAQAMEPLRRLAPRPGAYLAESDYFDAGWQESFWGPNYPRLLALKQAWDPEGLFFAHHGVGSEFWSADGFTPSG